MVTVVSRGPHPSVVKEVICKKCGSTLSYTPLDVHKESGHCARDGGWTQESIVCPICSNKIITRST